MFKNLLLSSFLCLLSINANALESIRSYEVSANPMRMNQIADRFEIVKKLAGSYEVYVKEDDVGDFLKLAPNAKLLLMNTQAEFHSDDKAAQLNLAKYRNFSDVERDLNTIVTTYKDLASLETYGTTKGGRKLYALKISSPNKNRLTNKPEIMVTAATHGDELVTVEVLFSLLNEMLAGYGKDSRFTKMIDGRDIYFIPVVSPDSFEVRERYVQGLDPNRSFPWPENINNRTVDCIQGLMDFSNAHHFMGSLDLHAYGKLVMFPWGYTESAPSPKDEVLLKDLVQSMARDNRYTAGQISTTIYIAKGSSADYFYWKKNTQAIAVELADQKVPAYNAIPKVVTEAREMMWTFLEHFN
ncbi:MAG: M14 family zinc carboxypeptidase [Bacteriovorax sp.]|nr:M14 family zinc carboxypeptidase [Bacteriovorax sp.]